MSTFAIVDLETTGNSSSKQDRILEIGIVIIKQGQVIEEFSSLVYPEREIPPFITALTGIQEEDIIHAPLFSEIAEDVYQLVEDCYIVAHNIEFDLGFLNEEFIRCGYEALHNPIIDTVELARIFLPGSPSFKLGQLADHLNIGHAHPHRALSDAQVTADLLTLLLEEIHTLPERTLTHILKIVGKLKSDVRPFIETAVEKARYNQSSHDQYEVHYGLPIKKQPEELYETKDVELPFNQWIMEAYEGKESLKKIVDHYEERSGQRQMSEAVYQSLDEGRHALLEAGAGTGKSLAYLLSTLYYSVTHNERLVIATHTTALQNQLLEEEIPRMEELFGRPIKVALYKGKRHYISLLHFSYELDRSYYDNYDIVLTKAMILVWLTKTSTGDIDEIQLPSSGQQFWHKISAEQSGGAMSFNNKHASYFQWAEERAERADLLITNHSLLCLDLISNEQRLPAYDRVLIDEAHHLEAIASRYFGIRLNYKELQRQLTQFNDLFHPAVFKQIDADVKKQIQQGSRKVEQAKEELNQLSRYLFQKVKATRKRSQSRSDIGRAQYLLKETDSVFANTSDEMTQRFLSNIQAVKREAIALMELIGPLLSIEQNGDVRVLYSRLETNASVCETIIDQLVHYFVLDDNVVKWIEIDVDGASNSVYLYSEPLNVAGLLQERLFLTKKSVVLTSATLTTNGSFDYMKRLIGVAKWKDLYELSIPSPYDYKQRVRLMVPNDFPNIKEDPEEFIYSISEAIYSIAHATKGRMLVLFTSYDMLRKTYYLLKDVINPEEFMVFAQGISTGSRDRLRKNFQTFDQSILLGTSSFWEGVDIPGDDLSCLVIVRLPFQPPDQPLQVMRDYRLKQQGQSPFMNHSLPQAIIRFKQGFGRLIRSTTDRGVVFVCDHRLIEAKYGRHFLASIPDVPLMYKSTSTLVQEMEKWL
ncbi:ATP-dependent DNA helicase DinG [Halobacillus shinanisalinarum]|uniref:3'-5' exonuclease DinG n=1 Tax=Halobacillus shinanisalinarum TaxID=2932258 RepID=A0ABY4H072_9BACI|nr:ATP-dependent DNA helicase DinG [Halobacillus shinanisalinarum]UOQ93554.1 ATP-dependent DNA helicase DinG [Halobacillus shinanisalinarum]